MGGVGGRSGDANMIRPKFSDSVLIFSMNCADINAYIELLIHA